MNEKYPLVSVIVPVYKVEDYLDACVQSLIQQTYPHLEIILVDDGSPDQCGVMCDAHAARDPRIRVIHKNNTGVAKARNAGLEEATGDLLFFVDSDDTLEQDAISILVDEMYEAKADMVCGTCNKIDENGSLIDTERSADHIVMSTEEALLYYAPREWAPWNRLIKASVHEGILFPPYKIHEDEAIKFRLLERCTRVVQLGEATYSYRQRSSSITASDSKTDRMDMFYSRKDNLEFLKQRHPQIMDHFLPNVCRAALYNLDDLISQPPSSHKDGHIQQIVALSKDEYALIRRNKGLSDSEKFRFWLIIHSNWANKRCLYIRFINFLRRIRK